MVRCQRFCPHWAHPNPESDVFALTPARPGVIFYSHEMISFNTMATDQPGVQSVSRVLWDALT